MKSKFVMMLMVLTLGLDWICLGSASFGANEGPVIVQSYAAKEIKNEDTWKIYLKASDPAGRMRYIYAVVDQAGGSAYPVSRTRIKNQNAKELNGYVYLYAQPGENMNFQALTLTIHIGDGRGNFSNAAVFPLTFQPRAVQEPPPPGVFKEEDLGPIMIQLFPSGRGDGENSAFP